VDEPVAEPFVFRGAAFADLEGEDFAHRGEAAEGEAAVAGETVVFRSGRLSATCAMAYRK
jgi:hypothetical protein